MSRGIIEKLARFFHEHFSLDHDKECSSWPKDGCQVCISAAHEFLPILAQERERVREMCKKALVSELDEAEVKYTEASAITDGNYEHGRVVGLARAIKAIRQLDLTKDLAASSREEEER